MAEFPDEVEVFITDVQGLIVGLSERTGDYLQADEGWWIEAYNNGKGKIYVGEVEYDDSTKTYAMNIGIPVVDQYKWSSYWHFARYSECLFSIR